MATYRLIHVTRTAGDTDGLAEFTNADTVLLPVHSSDPTGTTEGEMIYNSTDNTIKIYTGSAWETVASDATQILDTDQDTKIQVEESADEDIIRFDTSGTERATLDNTGIVLTTNGGVFVHNQTQAGTYTIDSGEGTLLAGPVTITGTVTNNGTLVII